MSATPAPKVMICGEDDSLSNVILCINKDKADLIASGRKNHEYRAYRLDEKVKTIWLYVNQNKIIEYVFRTRTAKVPGKVNEPIGVGNIEFDQGLKESKYGYEILSLHKLPAAITTDELLREYKVDMVNKQQYIKQALVDTFPLEELERVHPESE